MFWFSLFADSFGLEELNSDSDLLLNGSFRDFLVLLVEVCPTNLASFSTVSTQFDSVSFCFPVFHHCCLFCELK